MIPFPVAHWGGGPPAAPTNLTATPVTPTQVFLQWQDNSVDETSFRIHRSTAPGFTVSPATEIGFAAANATNFPDGTAQPGTTYYYKVVARNEYGDSPPSNEASATTPGLSVPAAPTNLVVTPGGGGNILVWQDNSNNETGFRIEVSTNGGASWSTLDTVPQNTTFYEHSPLAVETAYLYRVFAFNGAGSSSPSNTAGAHSRPAAPSNLSAVAVSPTRIDLAWTNNSTIATQVEVHRSTTPGFVPTSATRIQTLAASATSYQDTTVSPGVTYYYRVRALNMHGIASDPSNQASATPGALPTVSNLQVLVQRGTARAQFDAGPGTESVRIDYETFVGEFSEGRLVLQTIDTTPGGTGYVSAAVSTVGKSRIVFYAIPFSGDNGTGIQGQEQSASLTLL